jgi:hypothetical protein
MNTNICKPRKVILIALNRRRGFLIHNRMTVRFYWGMNTINYLQHMNNRSQVFCDCSSDL